MEIHIKKPQKVEKKSRPRSANGRFRRSTNRELMEKGLRRKQTKHFYVLHDENEDRRKSRMRKENLVALVALVKHHPDRMPVWIREYLAAGGPKGPAGA